MLNQDAAIVTQANERCRAYGIDPSGIPIFSEHLSSEGYKLKIEMYSEILDVVKFFMDKFLSSVEGTPFFVAVTDEKGHVLRLAGDSTVSDSVSQLGIKEGVRYIEKDAGVNSVTLALHYDQPIQLVGTDHYHQILHNVACYSVPFRRKGEEQLLGTISLLTHLPHENPLLLVMLQTTVDSIERELQVLEKNKQLHILNQGLLQTSYQAVIVTNALGEVIECNEHGQQIINLLSPKRDSVTSILFVDEISFFFKEVLSKKQEFIGNELSLSINDIFHYFIVDVIPIFDDRNSLIFTVGSLRDISEMKRTEAYLRNSEKLTAVGEMAAGVAHEIRNPLTTIKGLIQFSKDQLQSNYYSLLISEIDRMNLIVSEFLVLGKPHLVQFSEVEFISILNDVLRLFETQALMNGIMISKDIKRYGQIYCDPNQIKQVLINLLKNATEAMQHGGKIHIEIDIRDSNQLICIRDNGEGMSEVVLNTIGQPFSTTKKGGNGLGIMVTKKIIESHNGTIRFESQIKKGTTVDIRLPLLNN